MDNRRPSDEENLCPPEHLPPATQKKHAKLKYANSSEWEPNKRAKLSEESPPSKVSLCLLISSDVCLKPVLLHTFKANYCYGCHQMELSVFNPSISDDFILLDTFNDHHSEEVYLLNNPNI